MKQLKELQSKVFVYLYYGSLATRANYMFQKLEGGRLGC